MKMLSIVLALFAFSVTAFAEKPQTLPQLLLGLDKPANWKDLAPWKSGDQFTVAAADLPNHYDLREQVHGGLPVVNRQVNSDCWAQGTTGVLEINVAIAESGLKDRQSVQHVIDCSGQGTARGGGYWAYSLFKSFGSLDLEKYPYTGRDGRCRQSGMTAHYHVAEWGYVGNRNRGATTTEVKQAIMDHGAVGTTITANGSLSNFRNVTPGTVFNGCSRGGTNHIEVIVGWDDMKKAWLVRNSWGESHGESGYAWIPYGCSHVGEDVTYVVLAKD
jgi:C1A family cysteine protease